MWEPQFSVFAQHYRVLRYDLRGFGQSPMPDGPFDPWGDLAAVLDAAQIGAAHIVGASMGGGVALDFALMMPERVKSLVLASPAVGGHVWSEAVQAFGEAEDAALDAGDIDLAVELNLRMWVDGVGRSRDQVDPVVRKRVGEMQRQAFELPNGAGVPGRLSPPALERLAEIGVPALILVGEHDVGDFHTMAGILEQRISGARRLTVPGAAHLVSLEQPDVFAERTLSFLAGLHSPD
jgi:pimeloyl-ACP methyl ester carboxylesterase